MRPKYHKDVAAWAASAPAQRIRWWNLLLFLSTFGVVLLLGALFGNFAIGACVAIFMPTLLVMVLLVNARRRCPACGQAPNGYPLSIQSVTSDFRIHCYHRLVPPYGRAPGSNDPNERAMPE